RVAGTGDAFCPGEPTMTDPSLLNAPAPVGRYTRPGAGANALTRLLVLSPHPEDATRIARVLSHGGAARVGCVAVTRIRDALRRLRGGGFDAVLVDADALTGDRFRELERIC